MSRSPYVHTKKEFLQEIVEPEFQSEQIELQEIKEFLQEIVEPEVQSEQIELQEINWDDLTERQREEIIQKERLKDARPEKRPV